MLTISMSIQGNRCLIVGGGKVAERRARRFLQEGAKVTIISPEITELLQLLYDEGRIEWIPETYHKDYVKGYRFVVVATPNEVINDEASADGRAAGALVNRSDKAEESDFIIANTASLGDLEFAFVTGGISPRISKLIREDLESRYGELGAWLHLMRGWRQELKHRLPSASERESFWRAHLGPQELEAILAGRGYEIKEIIENAISCIRAQS